MNTAIGFGMLVAAVVSGAPTVWWLSIVSTMGGPNSEPHLSGTLGYIALSAPFLIIPAVAIFRGLNLVSSRNRKQGQPTSLSAVWLWVLLLLNPFAYMLWLMHSLEDM